MTGSAFFSQTKQSANGSTLMLLSISYSTGTACGAALYAAAFKALITDYMIYYYVIRKREI